MPTGQYIRKPRVLSSRQAIFPVGPSVAYIPLSKGLFALVDWDDANWISKYNWYCSEAKNKTTYAIREATVHDDFKYTRMHIAILLPKDSRTPDHSNGNGLDNRRSNLRLANHNQQSYNRKVRSDNTSGCKGVSWYEKLQKWMVSITFNGKRKHIGYFYAKEDAAQAYILAAYLYHGEFARIT